MRKKEIKSGDPKQRLRFFKEKVEKELERQSDEAQPKQSTDRKLNASFEMVSTKCSSPVKYEPIKSILFKRKSNIGSGLHIAQERKFRILRSKIIQRKPTLEQEEPFNRIGLLGEGGSSYVYLVEDKTTTKKMVLKQYKKSTRKALKEYLIGKSLSHESIVEYYEHRDNRIFMEYVQPEKARCPLIILAYKLAEAIYYLHSNNVCHTDIKPKNIIVTGMGVKLIDFGQSMRGQLWKKGKTGTYGYMAPQMFEDGYWNGKEVDVWSFGMVCKDWRLHQIAQFCLAEKKHRPSIEQVLAHPIFRSCAGFR